MATSKLKFCDESLTSEAERNGQNWYDLIQNLSTNQIETLKATFKRKCDDESLNKEDFLNAIFEVFDTSDCSYQSVALFEEINRNNKMKISWTDFFDFLLENLVSTNLPSVNLHITDIIDVPHTKRETIVKIVLIETEKYFCYAMVSKHGRVGLYDGNLDFLTTYHLIMTREDINRKEEHRRRRNRWVTDAIFCADVLMFIVTNTARSVIIYEASGLKHVPLWLILSTPNIVECFAYKSSKEEEKGESILFMGDDSGKVFSFNFPQPKVGLLRKKHNDKINLFYWDELPNEKDFIVIKQYGRLHKESVRHLTYFDDNETVISCSRDPQVSIIKKYTTNKNKPYIFKMPKGTNCFALSILRKILITGSEDGILRLWNPIITSKPMATLAGHNSAIVDVKIMDNQNLFLSCSRDGVLKLWDIKDQKCLQSLIINFPSFTVFGKSIEWGIECIYAGPKRTSMNDNNLEIWERSQIIIACCNHIALIKLTFRDRQIEDSFEMQVLPPPPLQNSVLVPNTWRTSDNIEWCYSDEMNEHNIVNPDILERKMNDLKFILERDFLADNGLKSDINFKIATLERRKMHMQQHVERGAPYLALDLHEIKDFQLTSNLPVPNKKKIKTLVGKVEKVLLDANFRDLVFSEPSSSRSPRSSRSSVVEFEY